MSKLPTAVLISGSGSNLQALIDAAAAADYPAEITLVISNIPDAYGLWRARDAGIDTQVIAHQDFPDRERFDAAVHDALVAHGIELVCLAGFMRILSESFTKKWEGRMLNIHPSLLPKYKGLQTHQRAIESGDAEAGATVHWVTAELDSGAIIAQARVPVLPDDTAETLAERVLKQEHQLYPAVLKQVAAGLR
jgi:phosphoribosylglycinamide formyltransferase-1